MPHDYSPADIDTDIDTDIEQTTTTTVGALAEGFANSAINGTSVEDDSTGYVGAENGNNRDNTTTDTDVTITLDADVSVDQSDNSSQIVNTSWSNTETMSVVDTDVKEVSDSYNYTNTHTDYDWNYNSESYTRTDVDMKSITENDNDVITTNTATSFSSSAADSFNSADSDNDFATLDSMSDFGNLGIAGGDLAFNLGDDFSFTLNVNSILNNSLDGLGNDSGFSAVQANHLADQDVAYNLTMDNRDAHNDLRADAGDADGASGMRLDGDDWDLDVNDDVAGTSTANASAILANSGFHFEFIQGANLLTNSIDSSVVGNDSSYHNVGEDADT